MKNGSVRIDIAAALNYIKRYACDGLGVERLVKETQRVSPSVFARQFRLATGQTPQQAIRQHQLDEACRLLTKTELSLGFVAESSGFQDVAALERALRAADGKAAGLLKRARAVREDGRHPKPAKSIPPALRRPEARQTASMAQA
jgi:transcriptional regulator GlxA family with amidase domain